MSHCRLTKKVKINFSVNGLFGEYLDVNIRLCEQHNITNINSSFLVRKLTGINSLLFSEILLMENRQYNG